MMASADVNTNDNLKYINTWAGRYWLTHVDLEFIEDLCGPVVRSFDSQPEVAGLKPRPGQKFPCETFLFPDRLGCKRKWIEVPHTHTKAIPIMSYIINLLLLELLFFFLVPREHILSVTLRCFGYKLRLQRWMKGTKFQWGNVVKRQIKRFDLLANTICLKTCHSLGHFK